MPPRRALPYRRLAEESCGRDRGSRGEERNALTMEKKRVTRRSISYLSGRDNIEFRWRLTPTLDLVGVLHARDTSGTHPARRERASDSPLFP